MARARGQGRGRRHAVLRRRRPRRPPRRWSLAHGLLGELVRAVGRAAPRRSPRLARLGPPALRHAAGVARRVPAPLALPRRRRPRGARSRPGALHALRRCDARRRRAARVHARRRRTCAAAVRRRRREPRARRRRRGRDGRGALLRPGEPAARRRRDDRGPLRLLRGAHARRPRLRPRARMLPPRRRHGGGRRRRNQAVGGRGRGRRLPAGG
mmetsp:Transcript_14537/g.48744  ORF Transcript_14537/g.48744 Transcript_14537/m.48744 type:complete len:212 (+) Transcript_14537:1069-1704(+)